MLRQSRMIGILIAALSCSHDTQFRPGFVFQRQNYAHHRRRPSRRRFRYLRAHDRASHAQTYSRRADDHRRQYARRRDDDRGKSCLQGLQAGWA